MTSATSRVEENIADARGATSLRHLLDVDSLSPDEIMSLVREANNWRKSMDAGEAKSDLLRGKSIYTLFFEDSTRTRVSFEQAGKSLGADVINIAASSSSVNKGESLMNTVLTLSAMKMDALVMRHPHSGAPNFVARYIPATIINAGDGTHAHPTQALLDVMTLTRELGDLNGTKIAIVGDIVHSRVARSAIIAFHKLGARVSVAGPLTLLPSGWNPGSVALGNDQDGVAIEVQVCSGVEEAISNADAVMVLRLQRERQSQGLLPSIKEYSRVWGINAQRLFFADENVPVMHPGPMNEGVEISTDVAHGRSSLVQEQVSNGVAMRMAVLLRYCGAQR